MAMYAFTLSGIKAGITRLRNKGGASQDSLWDLINAYVNAARDIVPRPGNRNAYTLPAGTIGLTVFDGKRHVYSHEYLEIPNTDYILHVMPHPTNQALEIVDIHFAEPLMGFLFVVAEYSNGDVFYFYLSEGSGGGDPWAENTVYMLGQVVRPTSPNGFVYSANRLNPAAPAWKPNELRQVGDVIEPTVFNGYEYECIATFGATPRSGAVEPKWPAQENAVIFEDTDSVPNDDDGDDDDGPQLPPGVPPRYPPGGGGYPTGGGGVPTQQQ